MEVTVIRKNRKTLCLEVKNDGSVVLKAPLFLSEKEISKFLKKHEVWIENKRKSQAKRKEHYDLTEEEKEILRQKAKEFLPQRTAYFADVMGVGYKFVKITSAKHRFGSCNRENGICYSFYLMTYPKSAIDYVIVHELAHTVHKNHSKRFYDFVAKTMPDYKNREKLLKE